jgi:hypothetical protein
MNKAVVKQWLAEMKAFSQNPSYLHLRFPMFMESAQGDLLSPEGILCQMHAKAGLGKWESGHAVPLDEEEDEEPKTKPKGKKLRGNLSYDGSYQVAPDSVLKWVGISAATMSEVRRANGEGGFSATVKYVEALLG